MKRRPAQPLACRITAHHFGSFLLCRLAAEGGRYRRTAAHLRRDDMDHLVMLRPVQGEMVLAGSSGPRLHLGDIILLDLSTCLEVLTTDIRADCLFLPRVALPAASAPAASFSPLRLAGDTTAGRLLAGLLDTLIAAAPLMTQGEAVSLAPAILDLLGAVFRPVMPAGVAATTAGRRMRRFIEDNLAADDLTPDRLAAHFGLSRRQLYRHFAASGGVESYIRRRRLYRCLELLRGPQSQNRKIGDIAYAFGFTDEAHFSRLFRRSFGLSPRAARALAADGRGAASRLAATSPAPTSPAPTSPAPTSPAPTSPVLVRSQSAASPITDTLADWLGTLGLSQ